MIPNEFDAINAVEVLGAFVDEWEKVSLREAFEATKPVVREGFQSNFDHTLAPYGKWPPHSPVTVAKYGPHPLLILTGVMLASVTKSGSEGAIEEVGDRYMVLGTDVFYAPFQQYGARNSNGTVIPPRPFLWLDGEAVDRAAEAFAAACWTLLV